MVLIEVIEKSDGQQVAPSKTSKLSITAPATDEAKQYEGWGTALKPAHEPIVMARKPLSEKTIVDNVLEWGTGGINIDESRIGVSEMMIYLPKIHILKVDLDMVIFYIGDSMGSENYNHHKVDFLQTLSLMKKQVRYLMNKVVLVNPQVVEVETKKELVKMEYMVNTQEK